MVLLRETSESGISYWQYFRLVFVVFFLYLFLNVRSLWFGYSDYASSDFFPAIAFVSVLWCCLAAVTALLLFMIFRAIELVCLRIGWYITTDHLFMYGGFFILCNVLIWIFKKIFWPDVHVTSEIGLLVLISLIIISIIPTNYFRNKSRHWMTVVQKRIVPLVWVFGIVVAVSVPVMAFQIWQEVKIFASDGLHDKDNNQPLVTFVFDDGYESTYTIAKPFFDEQGEIACAAVVLDYIGKKGRMTAEQILELQNAGWEILGHSVTHADLTTLTGAEIENELIISKRGFTELGFKITNFVYPYYKHNANARVIARKYYKSARSGNVMKSGFDINPYTLRRDALSAIDIVRFNNLPALEKLVDEAMRNKAWLMITAHNLNSERETLLNGIIDYIQFKGVKIVTIDQGLDLILNNESRISELLYILNNDSPMHILRSVHIASQRLLNVIHEILLSN